MNLLQPENEIKGQLMATFEKVKGSEPVNPNALYRLVFDAVSEKACYEFDANDYEQIKKFKGISRNEFDRMLDAHLSNEKQESIKREIILIKLKESMRKKVIRMP